MPELPEVETIARGLAKRVTGDVIDSVWIGSKPEPLKSSAKQIARTLEGSRIAGVRRLGKHIVFDLERGTDSARKPLRAKKFSRMKVADKTAPPADAKAQWIVHLGMTGRVLVSDPTEALPKHTHLVASLKSGRELRFVDPRRLGRLSVASGFEPGGKEPLDISLEDFIPLFHGRKTPIKSALLNQKLLRGVGNIYADESLFRAGIRPKRKASSLSKDELSRLHPAVQEVLREAIALGGSTISDYVDSDGEEGFFQLQHRVYGREGEPCVTCKTPIKRLVIAGRSSHYCPTCQK